MKSAIGPSILHPRRMRRAHLSRARKRTVARRETQAERRILVTISCVGSRRQSGIQPAESNSVPIHRAQRALAAQREVLCALDVGDPGGVVAVQRLIFGLVLCALGMAEAG